MASQDQFMMFRNEHITAQSVSDQFKEWFSDIVMEFIGEYEDENLCRLDVKYLISTKRTNVGDIKGETFIFFFDPRVASIVRELNSFVLKAEERDYNLMIEKKILDMSTTIEDYNATMYPLVIPRVFQNHEGREVDPNILTSVLYGKMRIYLDTDNFVDPKGYFHWDKAGTDSPLMKVDGEIVKLSENGEYVTLDQHSWVTEKDIRAIITPLAFGPFSIQMSEWSLGNGPQRRYVNIIFEKKNNNAFYVESVLRRFWIGPEKNIFISFGMSYKRKTYVRPDRR